MVQDVAVQTPIDRPVFTWGVLVGLVRGASKDARRELMAGVPAECVLDLIDDEQAAVAAMDLLAAGERLDGVADRDPARRPYARPPRPMVDSLLAVRAVAGEFGSLLADEGRAFPHAVYAWAAHSRDPRTRERVARNIHCPPQILGVLAGDLAQGVVAGVAGNARTPSTCLVEMLMGSQDEALRGAILGNPSCPPHIKAMWALAV